MNNINTTSHVNIFDKIREITLDNFEKEKKLCYGKAQSCSEMLNFLIDCNITLIKEPYKSQCEEVVYDIMKKIASGEDVPGAEYAVAHMYFAELALAHYDLLGKVDIIYSNAAAPKSAYAEFVCSTTDRMGVREKNYVQFYMANSFGEEAIKGMLYSNYARTAKSPQDRMRRFWQEVCVIYHEATHAWQQDETNKHINNTDIMPAEIFVMDKLGFAKHISNKVTGLGEQDIYTNNHDEFLFELQADLFGGLYAMEAIKHIASRVLRRSSDKSSDKRQEIKRILNGVSREADRTSEELWKKINLYDSVGFNSANNPNNMRVRAEYKASAIIERFVRYNNGKLPLSYREDFPSCAYTYTKHGDKKTLWELKHDRMALIKKYPSKKADIDLLYETIIGGDPQLSLARYVDQLENIDVEALPYDKNKQRELKSILSKIKGIVKSAESVYYMDMSDSIVDLRGILADYDSKLADLRWQKSGQTTGVLPELKHMVKKGTNEVAVSIRDNFADLMDLLREFFSAKKRKKNKEPSRVSTFVINDILERSQERSENDDGLSSSFENERSGLRYITTEIRNAITQFDENPEIIKAKAGERNS